jgi:hypothetical protein
MQVDKSLPELSSVVSSSVVANTRAIEPLLADYGELLPLLLVRRRPPPLTILSSRVQLAAAIVVRRRRAHHQAKTVAPSSPDTHQ